MTTIKSHINISKLPQHIAVIMDGNGRWAKQNNQPRIFGHKSGVKAVRAITEAAAEIGISYLTLYAFSTENWNRPRLEVNALMMLLVETIKSEVKTLLKNNVRLVTIGNISALPSKSHKALLEGIELTKNNTGLTLVLALNYSARIEIIEAAKKIAIQCKNESLSIDDIDENTFNNSLWTKDIPDPELLIRTSGEQRISNYLLWQIAYTELYFTDIFWPDFEKKHLYEAILDYQNRERRFGKTSEQIES